jgi:hypothetical protein
MEEIPQVAAMTNLSLDPCTRPDSGADASPIGKWVEAAIDAAPNRQRMQRQLDAVTNETALVRFLHRFVLFNDALAARVPFVAGLIHLTPDVFMDPAEGVEFCRQANGRVAAYVAEAASDEYHLDAERNGVHQHLSQKFLNGALRFYRVDRTAFDRNHPLPPVSDRILDEARAKFLGERTACAIFQALGFHVGLEFFAHQEFNLVDAWLRARHPELVAALERENPNGSAYTWLTLHTVVEIGHYRAGIEALKSALQFYRHPEERPAMADLIKEGFNAFADLQSRYYDAILCDTV